MSLFQTPPTPSQESLSFDPWANVNQGMLFNVDQHQERHAAREPPMSAISLSQFENSFNPPLSQNHRSHNSNLPTTTSALNYPSHLLSEDPPMMLSGCNENPLGAIGTLPPTTGTSTRSYSLFDTDGPNFAHHQNNNSYTDYYRYDQPAPQQLQQPSERDFIAGGPHQNGFMGNNGFNSQFPGGDLNECQRLIEYQKQQLQKLALLQLMVAQQQQQQQQAQQQQQMQQNGSATNLASMMDPNDYSTWGNLTATQPEQHRAQWGGQAAMRNLNMEPGVNRTAAPPTPQYLNELAELLMIERERNRQQNLSGSGQGEGGGNAGNAHANQYDPFQSQWDQWKNQ